MKLSNILQLLVALAASLFAVFPSYGHEQHTTVNVKTIKATGEISGFPSHQNHVTKQPGNDAILVGIAGAERRDHPCYMEFTWTRQNDTEHRTFVTKWHSEPCRNDESSDNSFEHTRLAKRDGGLGIASIRVCNNNNKRLKGVEISSVREITETGTISGDLELDGEYVRPNCADWDERSSCDAGQVAVGVNVYFDNEGATGLELVCGSPLLDRGLVSGPITEPVEPGTQHKSGLSGYRGKQTTRVMIGTDVTLPNEPLRHYGITSVLLSEHNDRPCQIKLFGRALDWSSTTETRMLGQLELDRCGSFPAWADILNPNLADEGNQFLIGIEVKCNSGNRNNNRIKGLKLFGGSIDHNGNILAIDSSDSETQKNCGDFAKSEQVFCHDTHNGNKFAVAVGLEMHHEDDAFTGIELICRDIMVGEYPALKTDSEGF